MNGSIGSYRRNSFFSDLISGPAPVSIESRHASWMVTSPKSLPVFKCLPACRSRFLCSDSVRVRACIRPVSSICVSILTPQAEVAPGGVGDQLNRKRTPFWKLRASCNRISHHKVTSIWWALSSLKFKNKLSLQEV